MDWKTGLKRGPFSPTQSDQLAGLLAKMDSGQLQWLNGFLTGVETRVTEAAAESENGNTLGEPVWILYGSHTGKCERLAKVTSERLSGLGITVHVSDMGSFKTRALQNIRKLLVIVSTHGIGEPPAQAAEFYDFLHGKKAPELRHIQYSVLVLGDMGYVQFCQTGKDIDLALEKLGGERITPRVDCDVDFEDDYAQWCDALILKLTAGEKKRGGARKDGNDKA